MRASTAIALLPTLAVAAPTAASMFGKRMDTWGGAVSLGPTKSTIVNAVTTLIPGRAPPGQTGQLFLWPGMSNGTGDLVQTTLEDYDSNAWCGATEGQWCIRASLFGGFGQLDGEASAISGDTKVRIEYNLMADGTTWEQLVSDADTGKNLTYFQHDSGPYMRGYGTGTECQSDCTGTIDEQKYLNTVITLADADTTFGSTVGSSQGAKYSELKQTEGGKVWTIDTITVPAMQ
ncbi:hypothetical protein UCDDS831_g07663 [Diplodia seriata]|uniref:Uncharacterized protein n=1 Tax=Diplodia seriata TaxID=420778 RepID=A0A0G2GE96_9PEZI|nr:hypothetical protein UCDDS831_g07663 [Diplodia seriata]